MLNLQMSHRPVEMFALTIVRVRTYVCAQYVCAILGHLNA